MIVILCAVCGRETPHRLLGTLDDGALRIYQCRICGTTHSRLKSGKAISMPYVDEPLPEPEPLDPEPDEDGQYSILWP
mgnify:CR=1 FL=1